MARGPNLTKEVKKLIVERYGSGVSMKKIAQEMGIHYSAVARCVKKHKTQHAILCKRCNNNSTYTLKS